MEYKIVSENISNDLHSDTLHAAIDAKKSHSMILAKLEELLQEITELSAKLGESISLEFTPN